MSERDPLHIANQTIADKYQIEKLVGEGGFAVVYRARHTIWNKPVAIKFFNGLSNAPLDQRDHFRDAFIQEGALLTELSSETAGIVQARDVGTYTSPDGQWMPYMVLEWLEGKPLDEVLDSEQARGAAPWPVSEVLAVLGQAASALDVAHGKGIAHRDIKPANLFLLGERGQKPVVKVLDFGVAKMMSDDTQLKAAMAKTGIGVTSFTPQYGAPEQFNRSYGATGPWTDVYALALVAVEMLTGKSALDGEDIVQLAFSTANPERRPTPRTLGASVNDATEAVFLRALAVRPDARYARAREFWADFTASLGDLRESISPATLGVPPTERARTLAGPGPSALGSALASPVTAPPSILPAEAPKKSQSKVFIGVALAGLALIGAATLGLGKSRRPPSAPVGEPLATAIAPVPSGVASAAPATKTCPPDMVLIPAGQFFMGSDAKEAPKNQGPTHQVTLDEFCIDLYEVTANQYRACSDVGKCRRAGSEVDWPGITAADKKTYSPLCTIGDPAKGDHPINCVGWDAANTYCKNNGKRLPTEAEWEYATRGPDGRIYPWGDDAPTAEHLNGCGLECLAWAKANKVSAQFQGALYEKDDGYPTTAPVGKFPAGRSRFGPFDVVGNVWEWVADFEGPYGAADERNPTGPARGEKRVIRGGGWNGSFPEWLHPAFRYAQDPKAQSHGFGFRCAE